MEATDWEMKTLETDGLYELSKYQEEKKVLLVELRSLILESISRIYQGSK